MCGVINKKGAFMYDNENENPLDEGSQHLLNLNQKANDIKNAKHIAEKIRDNIANKRQNKETSDAKPDADRIELKNAMRGSEKGSLPEENKIVNDNNSSGSNDSTKNSQETPNDNVNIKNNAKISDGNQPKGGKEAVAASEKGGEAIAAEETAKVTSVAKAAEGAQVVQGIATIGPVIAIIAGVYALILTLAILIVVAYSYAMPTNIVKSVGQSVNAEVESERSEITVESIMNEIRNFFTSNEVFEENPTSDKSLRNANVDIPVKIRDYNPDNEQDVALINEYKLFAVALSRAYDKALVDIEETVRSKGYDAEITMLNIHAKYPNGWKDVYKDVNYATLISIYYYYIQAEEGNWSNDNQIDVLLENYKNGTSQLTYSEAQLKKIEDLILDENNAKSFYHATYSIIENPNGDAPSLDITIIPYCLMDMYDLIEYDPDDAYDDIFTYAEMQDNMISALSVTCENGMGEKKPVYYTLGMNKTQFAWVYRMGSNDINNLYAYDGSGDYNARILYSMLRLMGYNENGAAGICGNIAVESGFSTAMKGDLDSVGLAQWRGSRRLGLYSYANQLGLPVTNIYAQAIYLIYEFELNRNEYSTDAIKRADSVQVAADLCCVNYEKPSFYVSKDAWEESPRGQAGTETYIAWERYVYSPLTGCYHVDLGSRRFRAQEYYEKFSEDPLLDWPMPENTGITKRYSSGGNGTYHFGIDIGGKIGAYVYSAGVGTVAEVGYTEEKGNYVVISHFDKYYTEYANLRTVHVEVGNLVMKNQCIGVAGKIKGGHLVQLHFGIKDKHRNNIDPLTIVNPNYSANYSYSGNLIIQAASLYIGQVPYTWGGKPTNPGFNNWWSMQEDKGLDCSGFVQWAYWTATGTKDNRLQSTHSITSSLSKIEYSDLQPGDLGLLMDRGTYYTDYWGKEFNTEKAAIKSNKNRSGQDDFWCETHVKTHANHVGIYAGKDALGNDVWIHCTSGKNTIVRENYRNFKYFYRVGGN